MEARKERVKKAAARRRARSSSSEGRFLQLQAPGEGGNRRFFYIAAGAVVVALAAFLCGVQMGKSFSELQGLNEPGARVQDRKGQAPPFRLMEKKKEAHPGQESKVRGSDSGEGVREEAPSPPAPKVSSGEASEPPKPPGPEGEADSSKGKYTLQVAALNNAAEAQELVNQLKKKGYEVYQITGSAAARGTLHRVRVGHFQSLQDARQFASIFEKKENMKTIISEVHNP
jgi:cell division septation protein DedD